MCIHKIKDRSLFSSSIVMYTENTSRSFLLECRIVILFRLISWWCHRHWRSKLICSWNFYKCNSIINDYIYFRNQNSFLCVLASLVSSTWIAKKDVDVPAYLSFGTMLISTTLLAFSFGSTTLLSFKTTFAKTVFDETNVKRSRSLGFRSNLKGDKKDKKAKYFDYVSHFVVL